MTSRNLFFPSLSNGKRLWGMAELHCHPAAHIPFGGPRDGPGQGLLWRRPFNPTRQDITASISALLADEEG